MLNFFSLQISLLQTMQSKYAKLEYDHARSLWINYRHGGAGDAEGEFEYEATFSTLVEQVSLVFLFISYSFYLYLSKFVDYH